MTPCSPFAPLRTPSRAITHYSSFLDSHHRQKERLRYLITALASTGAAKDVLILSLDDLADEVAEVLYEKARNADVLIEPSFYQILHSFFIVRGDYKKGAPRFSTSSLTRIFSCHRHVRVVRPHSA